MLILEIPDNDITNNVEILCPTNHNVTSFYDVSKQTIIIIKRGDYFEPVYSRKEEKSIKISKSFSERDKNLSKNIKIIFQKIIRPVLNSMCLPLESMPNVYKFKQPILLDKLISEITKTPTKKNYTILFQVLNFQSKVTGIVVKSLKNIHCFVPCFPSSYLPNYKVKYITHNSIWNTYNNTINVLMDLYKESKQEIPCKPEFKVIEDELIVGILTITNQFIQISNPIPVSQTSDNLKEINNSSYLISELNTSFNKEQDIQRIDYIKKIKLENNLYNAFRNTIRILLNNYSNIKIRENIENEINKGYLTYSNKLINVIGYLKNISDDKIKFLDSFNYKLINEISTCVINSNEKCVKNPLCLLNNNNTCQIILPKKNLLNPKINNEIFYFSKMSDELIRYRQINSFIFNPQTYLSFDSIKYKVNDNEIIVLQSILTSDYLDNLTPFITNNYAKYNNYDNAEPIKTQNYSNNYEIPKIENSVECKPSHKNITSIFWKKQFETDFKELTYESSVNCTYSFLINVVKNIGNVDLNVKMIKDDLVVAYKKHQQKYSDTINNILIFEGKKTLDFIQLETFIYSVNYYLTNLDVVIILEKYAIPSIFISSKNLAETNNDKNYYVVYSKKNITDYVFIVSPPHKQDIIPNYKIITDKDGKININIYELKSSYFRNIIKSVEKLNTNPFQEILYNFINKKKQKVIPEKIIVEEETELLPENYNTKMAKRPVVEEFDEEFEIVIPIKQKKVKKTKNKKIVLKGKTTKKAPKKLENFIVVNSNDSI